MLLCLLLWCRFTVITVYNYPTGQPTTTVCAGKLYYIEATFTDNSKRLAYMTLSAGGMITVNGANNRCRNTMSFDRSLQTVKTAASAFHTVAVAPNATFWTVQVASATGVCTPYLTTAAAVQVTC